MDTTLEQERKSLWHKNWPAALGTPHFCLLSAHFSSTARFSWRSKHFNNVILAREQSFQNWAITLEKLRLASLCVHKFVILWENLKLGGRLDDHHMIKTHQTLPSTRKALLFARRTEHFLPFLYKIGPGAKLAVQQGSQRLLLSPSAPQLLPRLVPGSARAAPARPCAPAGWPCRSMNI